MARTSEHTLQEKQDRAWRVLQKFPNGLSVQHWAQDLGMKRRTLDKWAATLEIQGKVYKEEKSTLWLALPADDVELRKLKLSPEEAMTLYLATRLFVKANDKQNVAAENALLKLADMLNTDANIGKEIFDAARDLQNRADDSNYSQVFRTIMQAYIYKRKVHITYQRADGTTSETTFSPYLLEPSSVGLTTYAVGFSSKAADLRTFKLERIQTANLTKMPFSIPNTFNGLEILKSAWSIYYGQQRHEVVLHFSERVKPRVLETRWHGAQAEPTELADGRLEWRTVVANVTDMLPWVRGWGADCEVIAPMELRETLREEAIALLSIYEAKESKGRQTSKYL